MLTICLLLCIIWFIYLLWESHQASVDRSKISHVIHVNGTRGKTTTCRLIDAGLRAGGYRVFCKTTGTDPLVIDSTGTESPLIRHGKANIKEQIRLLHRAAEQKSDILVIECMALSPENQFVSQHRILKADIGVITNVRHDHTDVMGKTLPEICDTLCLMIPKNGQLFTGEMFLKEQIHTSCEKNHTAFYPVFPDGSEPDFDFAENISLALQVCSSLGVDKKTALDGMLSYKKDPYALSVYKISNVCFINALSANDIDSTLRIWNDLRDRFHQRNASFILLLNNRSDRGSRTLDMAEMALYLSPDEIWLMGSSQLFLSWLLRKKLPSCRIRRISSPDSLDLHAFSQPATILAAGNIAGQGRDLTNIVRKEGTQLV